MTTNRPLKVFLCHSSADKPAVRELYQKLRAEPWIQPWLDEEELYPGQDWEIEIERAVESSDVVLVCLSISSINKRGFVQKELRFALDVALEMPEETIFLLIGFYLIFLFTNQWLGAEFLIQIADGGFVRGGVAEENF